MSNFTNGNLWATRIWGHAGEWYSLQDVADELAMEPVEVVRRFSRLIDTATEVIIDDELVSCHVDDLVQKIDAAYAKYQAAPDYGDSFHDYEGSPDAKPHVFVIAAWGDQMLAFRNRIWEIEARRSNFPRSFQLALHLLQHGYVVVEPAFMRITEGYDNITDISVMDECDECHRVLLVDSSRLAVTSVPYSPTFEQEEIALKQLTNI